MNTKNKIIIVLVLKSSHKKAELAGKKYGMENNNIIMLDNQPKEIYVPI